MCPYDPGDVPLDIDTTNPDHAEEPTDLVDADRSTEDPIPAQLSGATINEDRE